MRYLVRARSKMPRNISGYDKSIYHLLSRAFGQCVSIAEVVDLNILDIIAIGDIHVSIDVACTRP